MKKMVLTVVFILVFALNYGFAQTSGGVMGQEGAEGTKGHMQQMS